MTVRYYTLFAVVFLLMSMFCDELQSQRMCDGSLGDNIFTEGDFGSGVKNVLPEDPGLAPGYYYTTRMPVNDGQYTITNDIWAWYANWPTWVGIRDNSPDPNGYMMVVNASYSPGVFYEQRVEGVCENTLYEFSADVINIIKRNTRDHIKPKVSFLIDGRERYNTGRLPQDESWHSVGFTFRTGPGQTSVRLTLRNNAPGGTGNDLALDNISFRACGPFATISSDAPEEICETDLFPLFTAEIQDDNRRFIQWQFRKEGNTEWETIGPDSEPRFEVQPLPAGQYEFRFVHAASPANLLSEKCRSASEILKLTVLPSRYERVDSIAEGETIRFGDEVLTEPGVYEKSFRSLEGCDSVVTVVVLRKKSQPPPSEPVALASVASVDNAAELQVSVEDHRPVTCQGYRDGAVRAVVAGGVPPYKYKWSTGAATPVADGLGSGRFEVTVSDANGNSIVSTGEIIEPKPLMGGVANILPADFGKSNGVGSIAMNKGQSIMSYSWDNGETTPKATALAAGLHSVTIIDDRGCTLILSCLIPERSAPARSVTTPGLTAEALKSGETIRMESIRFRADSSAIEDSSIPALEELYSVMKETPGLIIEIGGHTNGLPEHAYCDNLSTERAKAVADWIVAQGISEDRVTFKGYGKRKPIASNRTLEGRKKNQRVEVRMVTY